MSSLKSSTSAPSTEKKSDPQSTRAVADSFGCLLRAASLLALAALYSPLSQSKLAPVYGLIPSAQFHHLGTALLTLLALTRRSLFSRWIPSGASRYLQAFACCIPAIQHFLFSCSGWFGPTLGPVLTEALTYYPLVFLSAYEASSLLSSAQLDRYVHHALGSTVLGLSAYGFFSVLESNSWRFLVAASSLSMHLTRTTLQATVGALYFLISPSKLYLSTLLPLLWTVVFDPHFINPYSPMLLGNGTLHSHNWTLLDRSESITGYVSVLENLDLQYRVLRCDHSLLGGEWLVNDERRKDGITVPEPIYAVFEMLEAVRLVKMPGSTKQDQEKNALVIGLGIGTAPKALLAHGIDTTIVELDPMVHDFATRYFNLPSNHTAVLQDAVAWVQDAAREAKKYDYILHDVFTGGAEPLPLFTSGFLQNLASLLSDQGVVALNYAGDLSSPSTKLVLNTINTAFDHQCRMFRDQPPIEDSTGDAGPSESDFLNMVIFCTKAKGLEIDFRRPVEADFLGSVSRRHYLVPRRELELKFPSVEEMQGEKLQLLSTADLKELEKSQIDSAKRHWSIMRKVMPDFVWENY